MKANIILLFLALTIMLTCPDCVSGSNSSANMAVDTQFRSQPNGFRFENWEGDRYPEGHLTADDVRCLFGDQVCVRFDGTSCVPTVAAKLWIDAMNEFMLFGRCEGMAALSSAFFTEQENTHIYGGEKAFALDPSNPVLLRAISAYFTTQAIEPVASITAQSRNMSLNEVITTLSAAMQSRQEFYTIGIYGPQGGHAITPYAIEDLGNGLFRIHVYDNNYPRADKFIDVDINTDTWRYAAAAVNPSEDASPWEGQSGTMDLTPLSARMQPLVCPFCEDPQPVPRVSNCQEWLAVAEKTKSQTTSQTKTHTADKANKGTIAVYSNASCDQIVITDKRSGQKIDSGNRPAQDLISGAIMTSFKGSPGCYIQLPVDSEYAITLAGASDSSDSSTDLSVFLPGGVYSLKDINLDEETFDELTIGEEIFEYIPGDDETPTLLVATDDPEGADVLYVVDDFTLGAGNRFTISRAESGEIVFDTDDPDLSSFDVEGMVSDESGDQEFALADLAFSDESELMFMLDEEGKLDVVLDSDGDGEPDDVLLEMDEEEMDEEEMDEEATDEEEMDEEATDEEEMDDDSDDDSSDDDSGDDSSDDDSGDDSSDDDSDDDSSDDDSDDDSSDGGSDDGSSDDGSSDDGGSDDDSE